VANPTEGVYPRDPCVIYHQPTKRWIIALYENGTTFYGSKNLDRSDFGIKICVGEG
jgi:levanase/fructan beta-fructosidase